MLKEEIIKILQVILFLLEDISKYKLLTEYKIPIKTILLAEEALKKINYLEI